MVYTIRGDTYDSLFSFMINQQRLIELFQTIVAIDSPTGEERAMSEYVSAFLTRLGLTPTIDTHNNVFARIPGSGLLIDQSAVLFNAHLDTVEPGRGIRCIVDGDTLRSEGNTILGADNKVAVAAILEMTETLLEIQGNYPPIELLFTTSEEVANLGAIHFDYSQITAKIGYSFDSTGELVGGIIIASPFYNRFDITIEGKTAHAAQPEQAINALTIFSAGYNQLHMGRLSDQTVCNIGHLQAGHVRNSVPGTVTLNGEVRSFTETELENTTKHITDTFEKTSTIHGGHANIDIVRENGGFMYTEQDPLVQHVATQIRILQKTPNYIIASGCYDANVIADHGIQILNIANGTQDVHSTNEHITISDFVYTTELALLLARTPF